MKNIFLPGSGPLPKAFYPPAIVCLALIIGALFLPAGDVFDTVRGITVGLFAGILVVATVGAITVRRREKWQKQTRTLDDLEPLGGTTFEPIKKDQP